MYQIKCQSSNPFIIRRKHDFLEPRARHRSDLQVVVLRLRRLRSVFDGSKMHVVVVVVGIVLLLLLNCVLCYVVLLVVVLLLLHCNANVDNAGKLLTALPMPMAA